MHYFKLQKLELRQLIYDMPLIFDHLEISKA